MRNSQKSTRLGNYQVSFTNTEEFHHLKKEIFTNDSYYFESETPDPLIIDAGAHIGLATLYFKQLYPTAKILAIEPNPEVFALLEKNIQENQLADVVCVQAALRGKGEVGERTFYRDKTNLQWWSTAGLLEGAWTGEQDSEKFTAETLTLKEIVAMALEKLSAQSQTIDLLKMDIEGMEQDVLRAANSVLSKIQQIFLEFHPHAGQSLVELLKLLQQTHETTVYKNGIEIPEKLLNSKRARGLLQIEAELR